LDIACGVALYEKKRNPTTKFFRGRRISWSGVVSQLEDNC
jgi:hypothetical protein